MTTYIVLAHVEKPTATMDPGWYPLTGTYEGANDEAAIKAALSSGNSDGDPSGEYVAVPVRSWKPRKVETKQAFSFS